MTNPFINLEYLDSPDDGYLPGEEQIIPADPETLKGLMEVYRDTANQLNAESMRLDQAYSENNDLQIRLRERQEECAELRKEIQALESAKKFAENASTLLGDELADYKKRFEKIYRHRDELAEKVKKARATRAELADWIEKHEAGMTQMDVDDALKHTLHRLHEDLGATPAQEEDDF